MQSPGDIAAFGYRILPYVFAIWLVLTADFLGGYLRSLVDKLIARRISDLATRIPRPETSEYAAIQSTIESDRAFQKHLVSDCVARVGFFNAFLASLISAVAATSSNRSYGLLATGIVLFAVAYGPLLLYMFTLGPGDFVEDRDITIHIWETERKIKIRPYLAYRLFTIGINVLLIALTGLNQYLPSQSPKHSSEYSAQPSAQTSPGNSTIGVAGGRVH